MRAFMEVTEPCREPSARDCPILSSSAKNFWMSQLPSFGALSADFKRYLLMSDPVGRVCLRAALSGLREDIFWRPLWRSSSIVARLLGLLFLLDLSAPSFPSWSLLLFSGMRDFASAGFLVFDFDLLGAFLAFLLSIIVILYLSGLSDLGLNVLKLITDNLLERLSFCFDLTAAEVDGIAAVTVVCTVVAPLAPKVAVVSTSSLCSESVGDNTGSVALAGFLTAFSPRLGWPTLFVSLSPILLAPVAFLCGLVRVLLAALLALVAARRTSLTRLLKGRFALTTVGCTT